MTVTVLLLLFCCCRCYWCWCCCFLLLLYLFGSFAMFGVLPKCTSVQNYVLCCNLSIDTHEITLKFQILLYFGWLCGCKYNYQFGFFNWGHLAIWLHWLLEAEEGEGGTFLLLLLVLLLLLFLVIMLINNLASIWLRWLRRVAPSPLCWLPAPGFCSAKVLRPACSVL